MRFYVENSKESTPKLIELIQEFSNRVGYKINAKESVAFLHTNCETEERELMNRSYLHLHQKTQDLEINLF